MKHIENNFYYEASNFDVLDGAYKRLVHQDIPEQPLEIPPLAKPDKEENGKGFYTVTASEGSKQFLPGDKTKTWSYNGAFLGPTVVFENKKEYTISLKNELPEKTTYHWHGLNVPGPIEDGGPFAVVQPGETKEITININQPAASLFLHPHPCPNTARQVWNGLGAMVIVRDEEEASLDIPRQYGIDDIPVILQDRSFHQNQFDYDADYDMDGTQGDVLLVNGTINPYFEVQTEKVRLRLLNASNRKEYRLHFSDDLPFAMIASDASLLPEPVYMRKLMLTVPERAEIIVDFSDYNPGDEVVLFTDDFPALTFRIGEMTKKHGDVPEKLIHIPTMEPDPQLPEKNIVLYGMDDGVLLDGRLYDMQRIDAFIEKGAVQIWRVKNVGTDTPGMIHPFHVHGAHFLVLNRNGQAPYPYETGWKDTIGINTDETVTLIIRFDIEGLYMYHCHILEHEDTGMMAQIQVLPQRETI